MKVLFTLVILLASNVSAVYADIPKHRSKSYRQVEDSQPSTTSFVGGGDEGADFPNQTRKLLSIRELGKKKKNGGKTNDNINRYQGKSSKHDKRSKRKRGKSDKSNKNLFGSRSGHTPTPRPTTQPIGPTPFPTNGAVLVWTPFPTNEAVRAGACSIPGEFFALTNTNTLICDCTSTRSTLAGSPGLGTEGGCCYENQDCESNLECIGQLFFGNGTLIRTPGLNVPRGTCGTSEIPEEDDLLGKCRSNNECSIPGESCKVGRSDRVFCACINKRLTSQGSPGLGKEGECCYENQDCESNLKCIGQEINDYGSPNRTPGQDELRGTCAPPFKFISHRGFVEEGGECYNAAECIQREGGFGVVCLVNTRGYCYPSESFIDIGSVNCSESNACGDTDFPACSDGERCIRKPNVEDCSQPNVPGTCTCTKGCSTPGY